MSASVPVWMWGFFYSCSNVVCVCVCAFTADIRRLIFYARFGAFVSLHGVCVCVCVWLQWKVKRCWLSGLVLISLPALYWSLFQLPLKRGHLFKMRCLRFNPRPTLRGCVFVCVCARAELKPTSSQSHHEFLTVKSQPINLTETSEIQYGV